MDNKLIFTNFLLSCSKNLKPVVYLGRDYITQWRPIPVLHNTIRTRIIKSIFFAFFKFIFSFVNFIGTGTSWNFGNDCVLLLCAD